MTTRAALDEQAFAALLRRQALVVSRSQALSSGMTPAMLRHRIRPGGPWQRLLPSVYLTVTGTPAPEQREVAALLYAGRCSVITGLAALRLHGIRAPVTPTITVLVPAGRKRQSRAFVRLLPTIRMPQYSCATGPVRFAMAGRAIADARHELRTFREMRAIVADAVQRGRCRLDWLGTELQAGPIRGSAWLRRALSEVGEGIRSAAEGDLRDLISGAGLPAPMYNARLYVGKTLIAVADAWWPSAGVAVEVDSKQWHLSPEDWERTLRRNATMGTHGIVVLHFTPRQVRQEGARVAADIRSAIRSGQERGPLGIRALPAAG